MIPCVILVMLVHLVEIYGVKRRLVDAPGDDEADVVIPPWRGNDDK